MDLLNDNTKKLFFRYLVPSLGSAMVMSIYTLTDAIVIGKGVGENALAALSLTTPPLCILMSTGILFGVGGSILMNIKRGLNEDYSANNYFTISTILTAITTLILWLIYGLNTDSILRLMGADEVLFPYAKDYLQWIIYLFPVTIFSNYLAIFVRNDQDPNRAMASVLAGGVINIFLDILLVMKLDYGIGGAALASVSGMSISVLISATHFLSKNNKLKLIKPTHICRVTKEIFASGISSFLGEFSNGLIVFLFNIQVLKYCGNTALSVYSMISYCVILFNSLYTGVGQAVQPIISYNHGADKKDRIKSVRSMSYVTILIMGLIFSLSGILFPLTIASAFIDITDSIRTIASYAIRIYFIAFIPAGLNLLTSYYLQSVLRTKESLIISMLRSIVLSCLLILILPAIAGGNSIWYAMPAVEIIVLLISVLLCLRKKAI